MYPQAVYCGSLKNLSLNLCLCVTKSVMSATPMVGILEDALCKGQIVTAMSAPTAAWITKMVARKYASLAIRT